MGETLWKFPKHHISTSNQSRTESKPFSFHGAFIRVQNGHLQECTNTRSSKEEYRTEDDLWHALIDSDYLKEKNLIDSDEWK